MEGHKFHDVVALKFFVWVDAGEKLLVLQSGQDWLPMFLSGLAILVFEVQQELHVHIQQAGVEGQLERQVEGREQDQAHQGGRGQAWEWGLRRRGRR